MRSLVALIVLAGCGGGGPSSLRAGTGDALEPLAWMAGVWVAEDAGTRTIELWLPPDGATLIGLSRTVAEGRTVHDEALRIEAREGGAVVYVASPAGQATTELRLVERGAARAVFENPAHDYPQRIVYERSGDRLVARIERMDGSRPSSWTFTRAGL